MNSVSTSTMTDFDRDNMYILPLSIIPLQARMFEKTRMIKNSHLRSVVEIYQGEEIGSGQIEIEDVPSAFQDIPESDISILQRLAQLRTYDVYSLRRQLRDLDIKVDAHKSLQLSGAKQEELNSYMQHFTRPLILRIFGSDNDMVDSEMQVLDLFRHPDREVALRNLKLFAELLDIDVHEVPKFIEDFGDLFMSVSYFRKCLDSILPIFADFNFCVDEILSNKFMTQDRSTLHTCRVVRNRFRAMAAEIKTKFDLIDEVSNTTWQDLSAEGYRKLGEEIRGGHTALGDVLCAMTVKMNAWHQRFPDRDIGGPNKWADYVLTHMRQGLDEFDKKRAEEKAGVAQDAEAQAG